MDITKVNYITYEFNGKLSLDFNRLTYFAPKKRLFREIDDISFQNNLFTIQGYTNSEIWANNSHYNDGLNHTIDFSNNPESVFGTNLETILTQKNWIVIS